MGLSTRNIHTRALDRIFKLNEEIISRLHQTVRVISDQCSVYIHAGQIADLQYIVQFKLMCNLVSVAQHYMHPQVLICLYQEKQGVQSAYALVRVDFGVVQAHRTSSNLLEPHHCRDSNNFTASLFLYKLYSVV